MEQKTNTSRLPQSIRDIAHMIATSSKHDNPVIEDGNGPAHISCRKKFIEISHIIDGEKVSEVYQFPDFRKSHWFPIVCSTFCDGITDSSPMDERLIVDYGDGGRIQLTCTATHDGDDRIANHFETLDIAAYDDGSVYLVYKSDIHGDHEWKGKLRDLFRIIEAT